MSYTLLEIAEAIGAELHGDPRCRISGVGTLDGAGPEQLTFLANRRYARRLRATRAAAVILAQADREHCPVHALVARDPYLAFVKAVRLLHPAPEIEPGVDASAVVSPHAAVAASARIGANATVGPGAHIGEGVEIGPGCVIAEASRVGAGTKLVANVTLCRGTVIGERVLLHPGVVVGADGFGLARENGEWLKIPQLGAVVIGNDVEIGANSTIDRGSLEDTTIEDGVKIDNQVHIGHNVRIGAHTAIAGCTVVAGSVRIGKRCMIGGGVAISGHIEITDDVTISGVTGVTNSIREPGAYSGGTGVSDRRTWRKNTVRLRNLDELARKVSSLEKKMK